MEPMTDEEIKTQAEAFREMLTKARDERRTLRTESTTGVAFDHQKHGFANYREAGTVTITIIVGQPGSLEVSTAPAGHSD